MLFVPASEILGKHPLTGELRKAVDASTWHLENVASDHEAMWLTAAFLPDGRPLVYALHLRGGRLLKDGEARWAITPRTGRPGACDRLRCAHDEFEEKIGNAWAAFATQEMGHFTRMRGQDDPAFCTRKELRFTGKRIHSVRIHDNREGGRFDYPPDKFHGLRMGRQPGTDGQSGLRFKRLSDLSFGFQ